MLTASVRSTKNLVESYLLVKLLVHIYLGTMTVLIIFCVQTIFLLNQFSILMARDHKNPLLNIYEKYDEKYGFMHWTNYAIPYHRHMGRFYHSSEKVKMLEMGVQSGGSSRIWSQYFGSRLNYTGFDINPKCASLEDPSRGIHIVIGSQRNKLDLIKVCEDFGPFDIIIDDGGHRTIMMLNSLEILFNTKCMKDQGVFAIEDTHTMSMWKDGEGMNVDGKDIYGHLGDFQRLMIDYYEPPKNKIEKKDWKDAFINHIYSTHTYDSLIFFEFQAVWKRAAMFTKGTEWVPWTNKD